MRAALVVLVLALTSVVSGGVVLWKSPSAAAKVCDGATVSCVVGDTGPGGGVVFYDAGAAERWGRFLEAAPAGWFENPNSPVVTVGVPSVPTSVRAKAGSGGVVVSWKQLPAGDKVQYYRVKATPKSRGCRSEGASCTVRGLTPGKSYEVTVVAVNPIGESRASQPVRVKVSTAPSASQPPVAPAPKPTPTYRWAPMTVGDPAALWCPIGASEYNTLLPTGTAIGTGRSNAQVVIAACGADTAAGLASSFYRGGGKDDWFLPSKDELTALYQQRSVVGDLADVTFWSSSQDGNFAFNAWTENFLYGIQLGNNKDYHKIRVRPVRAF